MAPHTQYSADAHKQAFELYLETRNTLAVSRTLGTVWKTIKRWADPSYLCPEGCPFHGWDKLIADREEASKAQAKLVSRKVYDPVEHDVAIRGVSNMALARPDAAPVIRPTVERVAHLEYLWSKVFYDATGIVTDWQAFTAHGSRALGAAEEIAKREHLEKGMHAANLRQAVDMLGELDKMIRESRRDFAEKAHEFGMFPEVKEIEALGVEDLRRLRREEAAVTPDNDQIIEVEIHAAPEEDPADFEDEPEAE